MTTHTHAGRLALLLILGAWSSPHLFAELIAYDGFDSNIYEVGSNPTGTDYPTDSLAGQGAGAGSGFTSNWGGPTTDGQALGDYWLNTDTSAAGAYYRASTGQATYMDGNGQSLVTTPGQSVFSGDGTRVSLQQFTSTGTQAPTALYMSVLVTLTGGGTDTLFGMASDTTSSNARPFQFGFNADTNLTAKGWNVSATSTSGGYADGTYLLVARAAEGDTLDVWINPLLGDEVGSGAPILSLSGGGFYVSGASTWSINGFVVDSQGTGSITFDEIRVGETFADVTPAIPEPSTLVLSFVAMMALGSARLLRRGRKQ